MGWGDRDHIRRHVYTAPFIFPLLQGKENEEKCESQHFSKKTCSLPQTAADINILFGSIFVS